MEKRTSILSACFLATAGIAAGGAGAPALSATIEQNMIAKERAIAKAVAAGDEPAFAKLVAGDAITIGPRGVMTAVEEEKHMPDAAGPQWKISDVHVKPIDDHVVVVYYRGTEDGPSDSEHTDAWHSTVWTQRHGEWVAEYHQQTPVPPEAHVTSTFTVRAISPAELRDRVQLAKDIASELVNGSRPLSDTAASTSSTLITVDRWPLDQLRNTIRDLALVMPAASAPKPGSLRAHVDRADAIAAALSPGRAGGDTVTLDRTAVERLSVELDALAQLTPLT